MKTFPTAAAWCFGILFISISLITTGSSEVQVVGPADPVVALAGEDVILPCSLKPSVNAEDMIVEWTRLNPTTTEDVHLYRQGRDSNDDQSTSYKGRTSMFHEELKNGNVSLKLNRVTLSDAGSYRCFLPTLNSQVKETTVQLLVDDVSPKSHVGWIVGLIAAAVAVLAVLAVYKWKHIVLWCSKRTEGHVQFVDKHKDHLIQHVTMVIPISFYLIRSERYSEIHSARASQDQMRLLYEALKEDKVKSDFYRILLDLEPDLVIDLDELNKNPTGQLEEVRKENDELKEELRKAEETNQSLSTSPGGQQETQTPSQKSERIEGMEMKSAPEMESLLAAGPQNNDLDEMERGGRVELL